MSDNHITTILHTGQRRCYDAVGAETPCDQGAASLQDAAMGRGLPWPEPRFEETAPGIVEDRLTDLLWSKESNPLGFPCTWREALDGIEALNTDAYMGRADWRLPNRRELRSLVSHAARTPALPAGHPFGNVFLGWYWSSTTAAKALAYAWYVHFEGGRMFYGAKSGYCLAWPVSGKSHVIPRTGQHHCFGDRGEISPCSGAPHEDGALQLGAAWPEPRFKELNGGVILDRLTNLAWSKKADAAGLLTWEQALVAAFEARQEHGLPWRLPNINELESLVDCSRHDPALSEQHPFENVQEAYWSSTTSFFETDWSYCLYMHKGAVGVGHKPKAEFHAWLAMDAIELHADSATKPA